MQKLKATDTAIKKAAKIIQNGGIVAFPTETVYGLGANALNKIAVSKIFEIKNRPSFDPLIVHIASIKDVSKYAYTTKIALELAKRFWPGPLTIVLRKKKIIPDIVTAGLETIGIRIPNNPIALKLIKYSKVPIAAPSANKFGYISPTKAIHITKNLKGVDLILDGGKTPIGVESTIISIEDNNCTILRYGAITKEQLKAALPNVNFLEKPNKKVIAPGMLKSHYAPNKTLIILNSKNKEKIDKSKSALISFTGKDTKGYKIVKLLTKNQDLNEYAANLFSVMHELDKKPIKFIVAEPVPEIGIGKAIMDRLKKAQGIR